MIRLRLEALVLGAAARLGRRGPNRELRQLAQELSDLTRRGPRKGAGAPGQPAPMRDR